MIVETPKAKIDKSPIKKTEENKPATEKIIEPINEEQKEVKQDETKPEEKKKPIVKKEIIKKDYAVVNIRNSPISTKHSMAIGKFIKGKKIEDAIEYLEKVIVAKKAIPMKGEIPHRKGRMMSGRFPKNASKEFIIFLKSLRSNANTNNLEEPIITEVIANMGARPFGRFGRTRKKRTNVTIKCRERKAKEKKK
jgi:ribosomal protein L22